MLHITVTAVAALIAGLICPPVVAFVKNDKLPGQVNQVISILVALAAGAAAVAVTGHISSVSQLLAASTEIWAVSQIVYRQYFRESPLEKLIAGLFSASAAAPAAKEPSGA
jgi:hypothetical protein